VVAQAFHWFDVPSAAAEFHRVLRPDGRLGVVWNERDESVDWVAELNGIVEPYRGAEPRAGSQRNVGLGDLFGPLQNAEFRHAQMIDVAMLTDLVASMSYVAVLPDDERAKVLDRVIALTVRHPAIAGRATFPLSYRTSAFWTEWCAPAFVESDNWMSCSCLD
jgi:SAM-dependent methyltransferase